MLSRDFENFELRLMKLREESLEDFEAAEKIFDENYQKHLQEIFPRDILGAKKYIAGCFEIEYVDILHTWKTPEKRDVFERSVLKVIESLPLSTERKHELSKNILTMSDVSETMQSYFASKDDISRDPFFALVEDFSMDGDISKEEFILLQENYTREKDFLKALESLPSHIRNMFHSHIEKVLSHEDTSKREAFEWEYHKELAALKKRWLNTTPVVVFVSRCYYKSPGKLKKSEHPRRRLRRTFKIALLKLLRAKLGNIDAELMLRRFEEGEYFEDFFMLLFKLLEVINENPDGEEVFSTLKLLDDTEGWVLEAEATKQKILDGEKVSANIANLMGETDSDMQEGILEKILDEGTHFIGDEIHFAHNQEEVDMAWIYAETTNVQESEKDEDIDYENMSPQTAYEMLKHQFQKIEEEKRKSFLEGDYDKIDTYNEQLLSIQSKLEKLSKLLKIEE